MGLTYRRYSKYEREGKVKNGLRDLEIDARVDRRDRKRKKGGGTEV